MTPESKYAALAAKLVGQHDVAVSEGKGFGSSGQLKVEGRIFAMLVRGELVVKLDTRHVDELVESGDGRRFDAGKGKPMREWFVLSPSSRRQWLPLAKEAMDFVRSRKE